MSATLLDLPIETPETFVPCANCPALQRLERELGELRREVAQARCEVGYWKSRHADALKRNEQLTEELRQAKGQIRTLQDKLFGRKSEKPARADRSNGLLDLSESCVASKKCGAQPGHAGHGRRDYSHLPVQEEIVWLSASLLACPLCGKPAVAMSASEDSELLEIEVRAYRRRIRRRRYPVLCDCDPSRRTLVAPRPPVPQGSGESRGTLDRVDPVCGRSADPDGQQRFGTSRPWPGRTSTARVPCGVDVWRQRCFRFWPRWLTGNSIRDCG